MPANDFKPSFERHVHRQRVRRIWQPDFGQRDKHFNYRSQYHDSETGLYYLNACYYDPTTGQFTQEDTYWGNTKALHNLTGTENLKIFARLRGVPNRHAVKHALEVVGLPYNDKKQFSEYSLGMKQRLAIANAIMHDPELLILDEPINGLDPIGIAEVRDFIKKLSTDQGKTILISSHILSEMSMLADDIGIIDHGVLLEEESLDDLKQKNSMYVHFTLSGAAPAAAILEKEFHTSDFKVFKTNNCANSKLAERQGRKAIGSKVQTHYDSLAAT